MSTPSSIADQRDLVDQGDVDVALGVFENFGEFGDADRRCAVGAGFDDRLIDSIDDIQRLRSVARNNLQDIVEAALLVPGVNTLWRVPDIEIDLPFQTRRFLQDGDTHVLCHPRIHGRLIDHDIGALEDRAECPRGAAQGLEVRLLACVDWSGDGYDVEIGSAQVGDGIREFQSRRTQACRLYFTRAINALGEFRHPARIDIEGHDQSPRSGKCRCHRQAHISEAGDRYAAIH